MKYKEIVLNSFENDKTKYNCLLGGKQEIKDVRDKKKNSRHMD